MLSRTKTLLLSLVLVSVSSCRTASTASQTKDTFTVTRDGKVLLFRGGATQVVVRKCPDFAALKEAAGKDQIDSQINTLCPKTDKNEKIFATSAVRNLVKDHYQRTYIPNGVPADKTLQGFAASAADKAAQAKVEAEKNRTELNNNIAMVEGELSRLNAYYDANPELVTDDIRAKLKQLATTLAEHKTRLAGLSDEEITNSSEAVRAKAWSDGYASFMDEQLFAGMMNSQKLVRLSESNPLHAQLIDSLTALSQREFVKTLTGHSGAVWAASYSPDGKYIVTGSSGNTAKIWDSNTGNLIKTLSGHSGYVFAASYSPDGKYIVTGSWDKTAKIWDANTGTVVKTLSGHSDAVSAAYSPDGKYIVTASEDNTAKIWNANTGTLFKTLSGHSGTVYAASYSRDGKYIVTGLGDDETAKIWDANTGKLLKTLSGHVGHVFAASYSPDGKHIVTGGVQTAEIWDANTGSLVKTLSGHSDIVVDAYYSPDGKYIVTGSRDKTAKIWDANTGALIETLSGHSKFVSAASFSPDGKSVVTGSWDGTAKIWDLDMILEQGF